MGGTMSILIATCPRCRTEVNTGISADRETMQQLGPTLQVLVLCGKCSEYQKMLVKDLRLSSEQAAA
jgi:RNase P subunit RPR2